MWRWCACDSFEYSVSACIYIYISGDARALILPRCFVVEKSGALEKEGMGIPAWMLGAESNTGGVGMPRTNAYITTYEFML